MSPKQCGRCGEGICKTKYENVPSLRRLDPLPAYVGEVSQQKGERS